MTNADKALIARLMECEVFLDEDDCVGGNFRDDVAARLTSLLAENETLRADVARKDEALRESADELDGYYRAEFPYDHPIHQKKRLFLFQTNPARAALSPLPELLNKGQTALSPQCHDSPTAGSGQEITNRIEYDANGHLDEVVTNGGAHLERMSKKGWFLSCMRQDGSSFAIWFRGKITLTENRPAPVVRHQGGEG